MNNGKQNTLSVGAGITLTSDGVISATADPSVGKVVESLPLTDIIDGMIYLVQKVNTPGTYVQWVHYGNDWINKGEISLGITTDNVMDSTSTNPIQNKAITAQIGYFVCSASGSSAIKNVDAPSYSPSDVGGAFKIKMNYTNTCSDTVYLQFNSDANTKKELKYNREPVTPTNTWDSTEDNKEVISVYYDGTYYQATNAQGGGGKAEKIKYDNTQSGVVAQNVQNAFDEIVQMASYNVDVQLLETHTASGIKDDGTITTSSDQYSTIKVFSVKPNTQYHVWCYQPSLTSVYVPVYYKQKTLSNKTNLSYERFQDSASTYISNRIITTPSNCNLLYVYGKTNLGSVDAKQYISAVEIAVDNSIKIDNLVVPVEKKFAKSIKKSDGSFGEAASVNYTLGPTVNIYNVSPNTVYLASGYQPNVSGTAVTIAYYNDSTYIGYEEFSDMSSQTYIEKAILTPNNCNKLALFGQITVGDLRLNYTQVADEDVFKYTTILPSFIGGNTIASTGSQGSIIAFGTLEANAMKYIHSRLFNVASNSIITFNCDINTVEVKAVFYTKNYELVSAPVVHNSGDGWNNCSVGVPATASMVVFQLLVSDGNGNFLNDCNLSVNLCLNSVKKTSYFPRPADSGYQHLTMKVGFASCIPNSDTPTNQLEVETSYYPDHGVLCLPSSYTPNGEPTRLICFTHGHAVTYNQNSTRFNSLDILPDYWLSEGYAIFDMDGSITGTFSGNHDYEPAAVNSYDTAYEWIVRHFNVRTDGLFSTGRSQGGGMQFVLAKRSKMPILAFAPIVPFVSPIGYFNRAKTRSAKKELLSAYGVPDSELNSISWSGSGNVYFHQLTTAQKNMIMNNQYRFNAYTAFCYNRPLTIEEADLYSEADIPMTDSNYNEAAQNAKYEEFYESVSSSLNPSEFNNKPFIMFTCVTDNAINHKSVELFHKLLSNAGQLVQIHVFPQPSVPSPENSDHRFEINTENMVTYTNSKGITLNNVPKVYIEALAFWRKFENQDQNSNN